MLKIILRISPFLFCLNTYAVESMEPDSALMLDKKYQLIEVNLKRQNRDQYLLLAKTLVDSEIKQLSLAQGDKNNIQGLPQLLSVKNIESEIIKIIAHEISLEELSSVDQVLANQFVQLIQEKRDQVFAKTNNNSILDYQSRISSSSLGVKRRDTILTLDETLRSGTLDTLLMVAVREKLYERLDRKIPESEKWQVELLGINNKIQHYVNLYAYRNTSNDDLEKFIALYQQPAVIKFNRAFEQALPQAIARLNENFLNLGEL